MILLMARLTDCGLTAHLFFLCNLHLADHRIVQYIDNFGRGAVSDFVIQPPGADAVAQNRVRAVCHITRAATSERAPDVQRRDALPLGTGLSIGGDPG